MDPLTIGLITAAVGAGGSITGGLLSGRNSGQETKMQKKKRHLIDSLLQSLGGDGEYGSLFKNDYDTFQKSFVDPAKSIFKNQIAPQIQQESIYNGQQRGTGLDDQLLRAGVDLDQLLNQHFMNFQDNGKNRMQNMLGSILGSGDGGTSNMSNKQSFAQSAGGYLSSDNFAKSIQRIYGSEDKEPYSQNRKGFANEGAI